MRIFYLCGNCSGAEHDVDCVCRTLEWTMRSRSISDARGWDMILIDAEFDNAVHTMKAEAAKTKLDIELELSGR